MTTLTKSELQAMPDGQVVVDQDGDEWRKEGPWWWWNGTRVISSVLATGGVKAC